jgi:hypothetical protein
VNKRKRAAPDNPITAAVRKRFPGSGCCTLDADRPADPPLDSFVACVFDDATIRAVGVLVLKALLTDDRQIVGIVKDALKESDHIFRRESTARS